MHRFDDRTESILGLIGEGPSPLTLQRVTGSKYCLPSHLQRPPVSDSTIYRSSHRGVCTGCESVGERLLIVGVLAAIAVSHFSLALKKVYELSVREDNLPAQVYQEQ